MERRRLRGCISVSGLLFEWYEVENWKMFEQDNGKKEEGRESGSS